MEYKDGILQPQRIRKCDLAFYYGLHPNNFRKQIANFIYPRCKSYYYNPNEVEKIFRHLGPITENDVAEAQPRIEKYHRYIMMQKRKRLKRKYEEQSK